MQDTAGRGQTDSLTQSSNEETIPSQQHARPTSSAESKSHTENASIRDELRWQRRLLPLMIRMILGMTIFFFAASLIQLYILDRRIREFTPLELEIQISPVSALETGVRSNDISFDNRFDYARWRTSALLEGQALQRRYHQAGVLLISRIWTRYLGFVTGMILALVGAVFILGKMREGSSDVGLGSDTWKVTVTSTSPGIILAVLGTILMLATMATNFEMQLQDAPSYLPQYTVGGLPAPVPLSTPSPTTAASPMISPSVSPTPTQSSQSNEDEGKRIRDNMRRALNSNAGAQR
jgi:hypothetical protein